MRLVGLSLALVALVAAQLERPANEKEFKKLLRTKTNVLVLFEKTNDDAKWRKVLTDASADVYGKGTLAVVNCAEGEGRKLCKKLKVSPEPVLLKHFKDGEFHKDFDRQQNKMSVVRFMLDPSGDTPWEEDASGAAVRHLGTSAEWKKLLKSSKLPILAMFYAPWCGFCKRMKPAYGEAAAELKGAKVLAAMDVTRPENTEVAQMYGVKAYPTIILFVGGKRTLDFGGENTKEGIVAWMKDPKPPAEKPKEVAWSEEASDVVHLTTDSFPEFVAANPSVVVMFYAPWCGHCKTMKPEYVKAAAALKEEGQSGRLAAVDATVEKALAEQFGIKGFPTMKYFKNGEFAWDLTSERTAEALLNFLRDPAEPPPPPPPEVPWEEQDTGVLHLTGETFKSELKRRKHGLVMFYAPWCGHCKSAKPHFNGAAEELKEESRVALAAVDCTQHDALCSEFDVKGFPTLKYFLYGKNPQPYSGARDQAAFVDFLRAKTGDAAAEKPAEPPAAQPPSEEWTMEGGEKVLALGSNDFDDRLQPLDLALVMFYAPWCGHCKRAKPDFAQAAMKAKAGHGLAAVDCTVHKDLCAKHGVRGYPTIKLFKKGAFHEDYKGGRTAEAFLAAANGDPAPTAKPSPPKPAPDAKPDVWTEPGAEFVMMLSADNFDATMSAAKNALVMFYAPWCGHCKKAKPAFSEAASDLKEGNGLMAMDCTVHREFCQEKGVKGYPTIQVWKDGKFVSKYTGGRSAEAFRAAANGEAPPPEPPAPADSWDGLDGGSAVKLPEPSEFDATLASLPRSLVFFYAPWCGHCKRAKPDFALAAKEAGAGQGFVAVDCTRHKAFCGDKGIRGYPTIQLFKDGKFDSKYAGARTKDAFLKATEKDAGKDEL